MTLKSVLVMLVYLMSMDLASLDFMMFPQLKLTPRARRFDVQYQRNITTKLNPLYCDSSEPLQVQDRIVGGKTVSIRDYPYHLSLLFKGLHYCGAALLNHTTAVSGAHCLVHPRQYYSIRAGSSILNKGGRVVGVKRIILHPMFNKRGVDFDIGIVVLSNSLPYGPTIAPIKLPHANSNPPVGTKAVVTGWGLTSPGNASSMSQCLRGVVVPVMSQATCKMFYGSYVITNRMLCAGYINGGKDACQGDSGGPLVANEQLIGLVSWGIDCAEHYHPGVYVRVSRVRPFIKKYTGL